MLILGWFRQSRLGVVWDLGFVIAQAMKTVAALQAKMRKFSELQQCRRSRNPSDGVRILESINHKDCNPPNKTISETIL